MPHSITQSPRHQEPVVLIGNRVASDLVDVTSDLGALDSEGFWVVVIPFAGEPICARFSAVHEKSGLVSGYWPGTGTHDWTTSIDRSAFEAAVTSIRDEISAGEVYQANLTRRLTTRLPPNPDIMALAAALRASNPAPFSAAVRLPNHGIEIASASPERFLSRNGNQILSSPIKGTASSRKYLTAKDVAENVMIVDLVRNDLGKVCEYGSVYVPGLLEIEEHPGLVHLVSTVSGTLRQGVGWAELIAATFPPGSVTGAPKLAALDLIARLEPVSRGPYCGAIGWVDADRAVGDLNVAIRTFWFDESHLHFATGGGITWDSTPQGEWDETVLKAKRLIAIASQPMGKPLTNSDMINP